MISREIKNIMNITFRETKSHIKSIRFFVIIILLALSVLGGTFGINSLLQSYQSSQEYNIVGVEINADGSFNDALIIIYDNKGKLVDNSTLLVDYFPYTNYRVSNGTFLIYNLNYGIHTVTVENTSINLPITPAPYKNITINKYAVNFDDDYYTDDFILIVTSTNGILIKNATVYLDNKFVGKTDNFGKISLINLSRGTHNVSVIYNSYNISTTLTVEKIEGYDIYSILKNDPDNVIYLISGFVAFIVPISAIALAYDSISKEKMRNSLDLLLYRPLRRESIVLGKFLGTFLIMAITIIAVLGLSTIIIDASSPKSPSLPVVVIFIGASLILLAIYIFLQILISSWAKSTSSALLGGLGIWMLFQLFWGLIVLAISFAIGVPIGSSEYMILSNRVGILNPSQAFSLSISAARGPVEGIPSFAPMLSLLIWSVLIGIFSVYTFKRMVDNR